MKNLYNVATLVVLALLVTSSSQDEFQHSIDLIEQTFLDSKNENTKQDSSILENSIKEEFHCTGGRDPKEMTNSEYMDAFNANSCSPVLLLPGLAGTKLIVQIDCETLFEKNFDLFTTCGWQQCHLDSFFDILHPGIVSIPKEEYQIWMPSLLGPFAFFNPITFGFNQSQKKCFQGIMGLIHSHNGEKLVF